MLARKGQGATEYLILLAVVLVIAIVVVALLGFFPGTATDARLAQSDAYWNGIASPLRITDVQAYNATTTGGACGVASTRATRMAIFNGYTSQITINSIYVPATNASALTACTASGAGLPVTVDPGGTVLIDVVTGTSYCATAGSLAEFTLRFGYNTPYLQNQAQSGTKPLSYKC